MSRMFYLVVGKETIDIKQSKTKYKQTTSMCCKEKKFYTQDLATIQINNAYNSMLYHMYMLKLHVLSATIIIILLAIFAKAQV